MNSFDGVIAVIVFISIAVSFFRGILREILSLVVWILAFVLSFKYSGPVSLWLQHFISNKLVSYVAAFLLIFLLVFFAGMVLNFFIKNVIDKVGFGPVDHVLGIVFGAARGVIAVTVLLMFLAVSPLKSHQWYNESKVVPYLKPAVTWLSGFMPSQIQQITAWLGYPKQHRDTAYVRHSRRSIKPAR